MRVVIYNSLWPDISRFFLVTLIDPQHFNLIENLNEEDKKNDRAFPDEYNLREIPVWNPTAYNKIIVIFSCYQLKIIVK